ncbi:MAG TPA: aldo/keto reductase [Caulobacteraceae bacterium]|nr:aldo/keto reductase [Caulobacteraceae bacterium]
MSLPTRDLTTRAGRTLSFTALGFGTAPIGNMRRVMSDAEAEATVESAWDRGGRYFDTAPLYGHGLAERRTGAVLKHKPRDTFLLSTKVGRLLEPCAPGEEASGIYEGVPPFKVRFDYSYDGVMRSYEESLGCLGLDRVDILYVHDIDVMTHGTPEAAEARTRELMDQGGWRALDELRTRGDVAAIGAGVNEWEPCVRLMQLADPDVFLLAGRYTLLEQDALISLLPACVAKGVGVVIGGPFNSGILATGSRPGAMYNYAAAPHDILARTDLIEAVCATHGVRLAQAALQFPLGHPSVVCVIPGGQSPAEVMENLALLEAPIPDTLWRDLKRAGLMSLDAPAPMAA